MSTARTRQQMARTAAQRAANFARVALQHMLLDDRPGNQEFAFERLRLAQRVLHEAVDQLADPLPVSQAKEPTP
jgi:hypothetical protein